MDDLDFSAYFHLIETVSAFTASGLKERSGQYYAEAELVKKLLNERLKNYPSAWAKTRELILRQIRQYVAHVPTPPISNELCGELTGKSLWNAAIGCGLTNEIPKDEKQVLSLLANGNLANLPSGLNKEEIYSRTIEKAVNELNTPDAVQYGISLASSSLRIARLNMDTLLKGCGAFPLAYTDDKLALLNLYSVFEYGFKKESQGTKQGVFDKIVNLLEAAVNRYKQVHVKKTEDGRTVYTAPHLVRGIGQAYKEILTKGLQQGFYVNRAGTLLQHLENALPFIDIEQKMPAVLYRVTTIRDLLDKSAKLKFTDEEKIKRAEITRAWLNILLTSPRAQEFQNEMQALLSFLKPS